MSRWSTGLIFAYCSMHRECGKLPNDIIAAVSSLQIKKMAEADFPTRWGQFRILGFEGRFDDDRRLESAVALVMGDIHQGAPLVRIHSQCLTGDVFGSGRCDCGDQLHFAMEKIADRGTGLLIYQLQEGRGIGLMNKLLAYQLQDSGGGPSTPQAALRPRGFSCVIHETCCSSSNIPSPRTSASTTASARSAASSIASPVRSNS